MTAHGTELHYSNETCVSSFYPVAPEDCAGWVYSFASVAASLPACVVLSDMSMPGNPMFFVNDEFCRVTEYAKHEAQGRNCRFLQGPGTNPEHGQHLVDTLRNYEDSQTMLLNYRKSGEPFENLLTMRFVGDSLGRRRFCIGFQLDLTGLDSDPGPWGARALM